jgi:hypothetical protein
MSLSLQTLAGRELLGGDEYGDLNLQTENENFVTGGGNDKPPKVNPVDIEKG